MRFFSSTQGSGVIIHSPFVLKQQLFFFQVLAFSSQFALEYLNSRIELLLVYTQTI